jgi:putative transposase
VPSTDTEYSTIRGKKDCESIFNNICTEKDYKIHAMEVVEDHVHLFMEFHPSTSLSTVIQHLKGGSSYRLFKLYSELRKKNTGVEVYGQVASSIDPLEM